MQKKVILMLLLALGLAVVLLIAASVLAPKFAVAPKENEMQQGFRGPQGEPYTNGPTTPPPVAQ